VQASKSEFHLNDNFNPTTNHNSSQIKYEEISSFDEIMAAGTAAALVPIKSITMRSRGDKFEF